MRKEVGQKEIISLLFLNSCYTRNKTNMNTRSCVFLTTDYVITLLSFKKCINTIWILIKNIWIVLLCVCVQTMVSLHSDNDETMSRWHILYHGVHISFTCRTAKLKVQLHQIATCLSSSRNKQHGFKFV